MKKLFKNFAGISALALLSAFFMVSCGNADKVEDLQLLDEASLSSRSSDCPIVVRGTVLNTKDLEPIKNATLVSEYFTATTDAEGRFEARVEITEDGIIDEVEVSRNGFLVKSFSVNYGSLVAIGKCPIVTDLSWDIKLTQRSIGVQVTPTSDFEYLIADTVAQESETRAGNPIIVRSGSTYSIDITKGTVDKTGRLYVTPDHSSAIGLGIPVDPTIFMDHRFSVEFTEDSNLQASSSRSSIVFNFPIQITVESPLGALEGIVASIDDLEITSNLLELDGNGNLIILIDRDGLNVVGQEALVQNVLIPVLQAIADGDSLDEVAETLSEGLATSQISSITAAPKRESNGRLINRTTLINCDCGEATTRTAVAIASGVENLDIDFPPLTPDQEKAEAIALVRAICGQSGGKVESTSVPIALDKCSSKQVTTQEILISTTGTVNGFSFSYSATERFETTVEDVRCSTTTPCHQGCPG